MSTEVAASTDVDEPVPYADGLVFPAPENLVIRGTVAVIPGRGESPASYRRFATRLAADAYEVRVASRPRVGADRVNADLDGYAEYLGDVLADVGARPVVAVGSDVGGLVAAALARRGDLDVDALVLAGVPAPSGSGSGSWDDELAVRSACPAYRQTLTDDPAVVRGALSTGVAVELLAEALAPSSALPHLVLAGSDDPIGAGSEVEEFLAALPSAQHIVVSGAHHDVLNDLQHRSVAATIVTFLERLRQPHPERAIVRLEHSTW